MSQGFSAAERLRSLQIAQAQAQAKLRQGGHSPFQQSTGGLRSNLKGPPAGSSSASDSPSSSRNPQEALRNGFAAHHSSLVHKALQSVQLSAYDGDGEILSKFNSMDFYLRAGACNSSHWLVLAIPVVNMNAEMAPQACMHFLTQSHHCAHHVDVQYQIGINMEKDQLEMMFILPVDGIGFEDLGQGVLLFVRSITEVLQAELTELMTFFQDPEEPDSASVG